MVMLMEERSLQVLGLSETRVRGTGEKRIHKNCKLIYGGQEDGTRHGVAILLAPDLGDLVESTIFVDERIIGVTMRLGACKLGVIQVYAPQQGRPWEEKHAFYEKLQDTVDNLPVGCEFIIMGDMNGHVGMCRRNLEHIVDAFGVGDRNLEGKMLLDFCLRNSCSVMNTYFQHRESHKWVHDANQYRDKSVIDYFLSSDRRLFRDVKVLPGVP